MGMHPFPCIHFHNYPGRVLACSAIACGLCQEAGNSPQKVGLAEHVHN